ncbi:MAG: HAD family phosphatase [Bacteroidota bacterium]
MSKIKNIIFDLGGVLIRLNYDNVPESFADLGVENFGDIYRQAKQSDLFDKFEKGAIEPVEFRSIIRGLKSDLSDKQIDHAWNSILIDFPEHYIDVLKGMHDKYKLFVLSNTNAIHVSAFERMINLATGFEEFKTQFQELCYSNIIGCRKPEMKAYGYLLEKYNLKAQETLFIDDTEANIEGARALKIKTCLYPQNADLETTLPSILANLNKNT